MTTTAKTEKVERLTIEQESQLTPWRDQWLAHGLSTQPADRKRAEAGVAKAYREAELEPPRIIIWLDSPLAGCVGAAMLANRGQVGDQVWDQVGDQVWDQVGDQVWGQVGDQVWGQVGDQVWDQVWDQVGDQVWGQVGDQVWDQVWGQVGDQVRDQVRGQVGDQVRDQVGDQVRGQVWGQVRDQVGDQVWDQVRGQVRGQVWDQVGDQVGDQVRDQVWDQVGDQVRGQVRGQVWGQVWDQVRDQVGGQVRDQVRDQVWGQVWGQVGDQVRDQVRGQVSKALHGQHEAGYLSFYDYMHRVVGIQAAARLEGINEVAQSAGWWWPFRNAVILTERPTVLHRDAGFRLHCESGPAVSYPDGWCIYAWHGTRVPGWAITGPTADLIHAETNIEIRRCAIERLGWDEYIAQAGLQLSVPVGDPGNPGQQLRLSQPIAIFGTRQDELVRVLLCANGTMERGGIRRRFGLTVPATIADPVEAAAWSYGWPAHTYRQLQRRT